MSATDATVVSPENPARRIAFAAGIALALSGCVRETVDGDVVTVGYEWWVTALWVLGGLVALPAGWFIRENRYGWVLMLVGAGLLAVGAPTSALTRATVSPEGFSVHSGIWGATATGDAKFADVTTLRQTSEVTRGRRGRKNTTHYLNYEVRGGQPGKFSLGNDVALRAGELIVQFGDDQGIPFIDQAIE